MVRGQKGGEGSGDVDEGEGEGACLEAIQDTKSAGKGRKDEELDEHAGDSIDGEEQTDLIRVDAEAAGESEGEFDMFVVSTLDRIMHENGQKLVVGHRVHGQEGVDNQVDVGLTGKNLAPTWPLLERDRVAVGNWAGQLTGGAVEKGFALLGGVCPRSWSASAWPGEEFAQDSAVILFELFLFEGLVQEQEA